MNLRVTSIAVAVALSLALAPAAIASHADHTYEYDDTITANVPGAYATSNAHDYEIGGVPAGTPITATLTWDNPNVDMEVTVQGPGDTCTIAPEPETMCMLDLLASNAQEAGCGGPSGLDLPGEQTDEASAVTDVEGTWIVSVAANLIAPEESVDYSVSFTVGDDHGSILASETDYVHSTGHCALVE